MIRGRFPSFMIEAIDHVEIVTRDMEKSLEFYVNVLGFQEHSRHKFEGRALTQIVFLKLGDSMLEILEFPDAADLEEGPRVGMRMFALRVPDMDVEIKRLRGLGVEISREPVTMGESKRAEIKDPNGISLEIRQW